MRRITTSVAVALAALAAWAGSAMAASRSHHPSTRPHVRTLTTTGSSTTTGQPGDDQGDSSTTGDDQGDTSTTGDDQGDNNDDQGDSTTPSSSTQGSDQGDNNSQGD